MIECYNNIQREWYHLNSKYYMLKHQNAVTPITSLSSTYILAPFLIERKHLLENNCGCPPVHKEQNSSYRLLNTRNLGLRKYHSQKLPELIALLNRFTLLQSSRPFARLITYSVLVKYT